MSALIFTHQRAKFVCAGIQKVRVQDRVVKQRRIAVGHLSVDRGRVALRANHMREIDRRHYGYVLQIFQVMKEVQRL